MNSLLLSHPEDKLLLASCAILGIIYHTIQACDAQWQCRKMRLLLSLTCVFGNSSYGADRGEILDISSIQPSIKYLGESKEGVQTPFQIVSREVWETPP